MPSTIWSNKPLVTYGRRRRNFALGEDQDEPPVPRSSKATSSVRRSYATDSPETSPEVARISKPSHSSTRKTTSRSSSSFRQTTHHSPVSARNSVYSSKSRASASSNGSPPRRKRGDDPISNNTTPIRVPLASKMGTINTPLSYGFQEDTETSSKKFKPKAIKAVSLKSALGGSPLRVKAAGRALKESSPAQRRGSGGGKGLAPSPSQKHAPQVMEIIELNSEGETVHTEVRHRIPRPKFSHFRAKRIVTSDDEEDETSIDDGSTLSKAPSVQLTSSSKASSPLPAESASLEKHELTMSSAPKSHPSSLEAITRQPSSGPQKKKFESISSAVLSSSRVPSTAKTPLGLASSKTLTSSSTSPATSDAQPQVERMSSFRAGVTTSTSSRSTATKSSTLHAQNQAKPISTANTAARSSKPSISAHLSTVSSSMAPSKAAPTQTVAPSSSKSPYKLAVTHILTSPSLPFNVRSKFLSTKDPRLLFPYAGTAERKKILEDWLATHYFIPRDMDEIVTPSIQEKVIQTNEFTRVTSIPPPPTYSRPTSTVRGPSKHEVNTASVSSSAQSHTASAPEAQMLSPSGLAALLAASNQPSPHDFATFVSSFVSPAGAVQPADDSDDEVNDQGESRFRKVGEASYSEVFRVGGVVLKIIPLTSRDEDDAKKGLKQKKPWPSCSEAEDVMKEITATRIMGGVHKGFVRLLETYVIQGTYPVNLLREWDLYDERKGSESIRPDVFPASQTYAVIVLPHAGSDLEAYDFAHAVIQKAKNSWRQCASVFWQVCRALAVAEDAVSFEHRDLHWGQILIEPIEPISKQKTRRGTRTVTRYAVDDEDDNVLMEETLIPMDSPTHGVKVTIIDFGLSRMDIGSSNIHKKPLEHAERGKQANRRAMQSQFTVFEEAVFEGEGDYQFDIYRMMRSHNNNDWAKFSPLTNVMWLHYLARQLLESFDLTRPAASRAKTVKTGYTERDCWECLVMLEESLNAAVAPGTAGKKKRTRAKSIMRLEDDVALVSAQDVLLLGKMKGWIK